MAKQIIVSRGLAQELAMTCAQVGGGQIDPEVLYKCLEKQGKEFAGVARGSRSDFLTRRCDLPEDVQNALDLRTNRIMDKFIPIKQKMGASASFKMVPEDSTGNGSNKYILGFDQSAGVNTTYMLVNRLRFGAVIDAATVASSVQFFNLLQTIPAASTGGDSLFKTTIPEELLAGVMTITINGQPVLKDFPIEAFNNIGDSTRRAQEYILDNPFWIPADASAKVQVLIETPVATPADTWTCLMICGSKVQMNAAAA